MDRDLDQWPFPDRESLPLDFVESMPLDVPAVLSMDRFTTMQTSRGCPWPCVFCDIPIFNEGKWRSRSAPHVVERVQAPRRGRLRVRVFRRRPLPAAAQADRGDLPRRHGRRGSRSNGACEGRVDSVAQHLFPAMAKAHCRTLMFGIESGSQKVLDRLKKEQTLEEVATAVTNAKQAGIEIVHGFFVVGNPDETVEDMSATFDFASKLPLDTFGFNRLCVYRGTPLWQEYVKRGLVSDTADWYKYFKCSEIDPTCLPGEVINEVRRQGLKRLFVYKILHYPLQTFRLLRRFLRFMPLRDVVYLIIKPFLGQKKGATKAEVLSRAVEHGEMKDAAAQMTQMTDEMLYHVMEESRLERLRIQQEAETSRELPMVHSR